MSLIKNKLSGNPFLRRVAMLVGGTAIGQLIAILSLPIITRLYSPDAFSILAVYVSVLSLVTVASGMCFEYAIPLPKSERIAAALCLLAITSVFIFTGLTTLAIIFLKELLNTLTNDKLVHFLWLIPIGVFAVGMYNALQYWSTRNKKFRLIAKTRVTQSLSGTGIKLGAGYFLAGSTIGLIFGQLLAQGSGFISLGASLLKYDIKVFKSVKFKHFKLALKRYDKFPKYTTLEVFTNTAGIQLPIIIIAYYAIGAEAGYLMIAMQLLSAPMSLLSGAISQVYLAEGAERYHRGELKDFTKKTIINLAKISGIPLFIAAIISPFFMPYLLGDEWSRTGILISWMTPWFFMQFITSPVSSVLYITKNQKLAFYLQAFGLVIRVGAVYFAVIYQSVFIGEYYALSGFVFYTLYLMVVLATVKKIESKN